MKKYIYLDNQSTTPVDPLVITEMLPFLNEKYGNASSNSHKYGWEAKEAVEIARERTAKMLNSDMNEIFFTSGATESINLALKGTNCKHIVTLNTEHTATLDVCNYLSSNGCKITYIPVPSDGIINPDDISKVINSETSLVSILHVNNEIGVIQPISEIGKICKKNNILFHVDAAQSTGKIPIDVNDMNIDLLSISSHKMYGPKGIGALFVKRKQPRIILKPLIHGGNHQAGIRAGTLPVSNIVGFGKACEISTSCMEEENESLLIMRNRLLNGLKTEIKNIIINGHAHKRIAGNLNISFPGMKSENIMMKIRDIALSNGSACTSLSSDPSHVLIALGRSKESAYSSIRFGIGRFNTLDEIEYTINKITNIIINKEVESC